MSATIHRAYILSRRPCTTVVVELTQAGQGYLLDVIEAECVVVRRCRVEGDTLTIKPGCVQVRGPHQLLRGGEIDRRRLDGFWVAFQNRYNANLERRKETS